MYRRRTIRIIPVPMRTRLAGSGFGTGAASAAANTPPLPLVDDGYVIRPAPRSTNGDVPLIAAPPPSVRVLTGFWTIPVLPADGVSSDVSDSATVLDTGSASPFPSSMKATEPFG